MLKRFFEAAKPGIGTKECRKLYKYVQTSAENRITYIIYVCDICSKGHALSCAFHRNHLTLDICVVHCMKVDRKISLTSK